MRRTGDGSLLSVVSVRPARRGFAPSPNARGRGDWMDAVAHGWTRKPVPSSVTGRNGRAPGCILYDEGSDPATTSDSDLVWVALARRGDADAFSALLESRREGLLRALAALLGDWHEAEDALQEGLWHAFRSLGGLREVAAFDPWLRRAVLNAGRQRLRAAVSRLRREGTPAGGPSELEGWAAALDPTPLDHRVAEERHAEWLQAITRLPPQQRRLAGLVWVAALAPRDVARLEGVSPGRVYAVLHRARRALAGVRTASPEEGRSSRVSDPGVVRIRGGSGAPQTVARIRRLRPDLHVDVAPTQAEANVIHKELAPGRSALAFAPSPPVQMLPLDGLADGRLDLEPFGSRVLRWCWGERPYWLPHTRDVGVLAYNADLFARAGVPRPAPDWTWDDFDAACRRLLAAGIPPLASAEGGLLAQMAEQFGATAQDPSPVREAAEVFGRWRTAGFIAPRGDWPDHSFHVGQAAMALTRSTAPGWAFAEERLPPFAWGVAPVPRPRRADEHQTYWRRTCAGIPATAADPIRAFEVVAMIVRDGALWSWDGSLPDYRTPEIMRAWSARPWPLGKACLVELDAATDPFHTEPYLWWDAIDTFEALASGDVDIDEGMHRIRAAMATKAPDHLRGLVRGAACGLPAPTAAAGPGGGDGTRD